MTPRKLDFGTQMYEFYELRQWIQLKETENSDLHDNGDSDQK